MSNSLTKISIAFALVFSCAHVHADDCEVGESGEESIACSQKRQIEEIWVDMNKTASDTVDIFISDPGKAKELGCLDSIQGLDLSMFSIDPASIWTSLYSRVKDELLDQVCTAVDNKINEHVEKLQYELEAPLGIGRIQLRRNGSRTNGLDDFIRTRSTLSDTEAQRQVTEEVLGETPSLSIQRLTEQRIRGERESSLGVDDRTRRRKEQENIRQRGTLLLNNLFKTADEESSDGGNN